MVDFRKWFDFCLGIGVIIAYAPKILYYTIFKKEGI
jgi:hypothetical protein